MTSDEKIDENLVNSMETSLETPNEKKLRIRSLYIVHLSMMVVSLGSSIIFTGVYPYLISLDPRVLMVEYGIVVAADAAAQMIFSPLFGILIDKIKRIRPIALACCALFCVGNILYALIGAFNRNDLFGASLNKNRVWVMLFARFVVGAGTALNSAGRYYVASATLISERTTHISLLSLFQTLGFIAGPGIQAALTPLGAGEELGDEGMVQFNMYTSTGYVSATTGLVCFILYLPGIFNEMYISSKELEAIKNMVKQGEVKHTAKEMVRRISRMGPPGIQKPQALAPPDESKQRHLTPDVSDLKPKEGRPQKFLRTFAKHSIMEAPGFVLMDPENDIKEDEKEDNKENNSDDNTNQEKKNQLPPMIPILTCIYNFFSFLANFVLLETIMTKLAMDQWAWQADFAIQNIGFVTMGAGAMSIFMFALIGPLSKRFDERNLLIVLGIFPMILGRVIMFPIPGQPNPPAPVPASFSSGFNSTSGFNGPETFAIGDGLPGCSYDWCSSTPRIEVAQFMVGFVVATAGYPFCISLSGSIYSKVLGNINPGFWLGLFATSGSVARVVGPLVVTEIYELWGTYVLFAVVTATLVIALIATLFAYRQMVPVTTQKDKNENAKKNGDEETAVSVIKKADGDRKITESVIPRRLPTFDEIDEEHEEEDKEEVGQKEDEGIESQSTSSVEKPTE